MKYSKKASAIIIGNEILSGDVIDLNTQEIALQLANVGIILSETRTITDDKNVIAYSIKELSSKYDYVFTSGGIGPTHDDATAEAVANAFSLEYECNQEIFKIIKKHYSKLEDKQNNPRRKMSYTPVGATLIHNQETLIPSFSIGNVFVMAGIPRILKSTLNTIIPSLKKGNILHSKSVKLKLIESEISSLLSDLQNKYKDIEIGSYPSTIDTTYLTKIIFRGYDTDILDLAINELKGYCNHS